MDGSLVEKWWCYGCNFPSLCPPKIYGTPKKRGMGGMGQTGEMRGMVPRFTSLKLVQLLFAFEKKDKSQKGQWKTHPKTNMTMEHPPFEDVFPIEMVIFQCHVSFQGCIFQALEFSGVSTCYFCFREGYEIKESNDRFLLRDFWSI